MTFKYIPTNIGFVLRIVLALSTLLTLLIATYTLLNADFVPQRYLKVLLPLYFFSILAISILALSSKRPDGKRHLGLSILLLIAILTNLGISSASLITSSLIGSVHRTNVSYVEYSVVAKKGSSAQLGKANSYGLITTDQLYAGVLKELPNRANANIRDYDSLIGVFDGLINSDSIHFAALRSSSLGIVRDNNVELYEKVAVVDTFEVRSSETQVEVRDITKPYAVYISGIDAYGSVGSVSRSDVNMLAIVNPSSRKVLLVNTPRDYYVQLHGTTGLKDKLTHAGVYGVDMSRKTMEDLYGISIPYYMRVNFTSLVKIIDAIGPISVYSPYSFKSYNVGYNTLDSKSALEFSRERYSFEDGDRQRGRNQQYVIEAIITKMGRLENAVKIPAIAGNLKSSIETNMPEESLKGVIRGQLDDTRPWTVKSVAVDGGGAMLPTYSYGNSPLYVMVPDQNSVESAKQQIRQYSQ